MPLRRDPTRTITLQKQFITDVRKRFRAVKKAIRELIIDQDVFGLVPGQPFAFNVEKQAWRFHTDDKKVDSFNKWLQEQIDSKVLTTDHKGDPWTAKYIDSAYRKGSVKAFLDARKLDLGKRSAAFQDGSKEEFLRSAFDQPVRLSKVKLLATRSFGDMRGASDAMKQQLNTELASGLANAQGPRAIAQAMTKKVDGITKKRALVIARTEVIHAHAEGQLDSFEDLGVDELGIEAEWSTAGDARVCPLCQPLEAQVFTVKEARGLIPRHPNCRCSWIPASFAEERGTKADMAKAVKQSVKAENPKESLKQALSKSVWIGRKLARRKAAKKVGKKAVAGEAVAAAPVVPKPKISSTGLPTGEPDTWDFTGFTAQKKADVFDLERELLAVGSDPISARHSAAIKYRQTKRGIANRAKKAKTPAPSVVPPKTVVDAETVKVGGRAYQQAPLTDASKVGLKEYQAGAYQSEAGGFPAIQSVLREGQPEAWIARSYSTTAKDYNKFIKGVDKALEGSTLAQETVVFRGIKDPRAQFGIQSLEELKPGLRYTDKGYTSTSTAKSVVNAKFQTKPNSWDDPKMLHIRVPKGHSAFPMADQHEKEVLLPRGLTFEVKKVKGKNVFLDIVETR